MKGCFLFLLLSLSSLCYSHPDSIPAADSTKKTEKHRKFKIAIDYSSDNTFRGRKDTSNIPILTPYMKFTGKRGFYLDASLVNTPGVNAKKLFDEMDAGAGWLFDFSENWDGSLSYTHYFFDSKVARIKASVQNDLNIEAGYDWDILYSQLLFDYNSGNPKFTYKGKTISKHTRDFSTTFVNMHAFYIELNSKSKLIISPEADVIFGTQNFLTTYRGKNDASQTKYQKQASKFSLTAFELYLNVKYRIKKFTISLDPYYTFPENVMAGESSTPYFILSGSFYYTF